MGAKMNGFTLCIQNDDYCGISCTSNREAWADESQLIRGDNLCVIGKHSCLHSAQSLLRAHCQSEQSI